MISATTQLKQILQLSNLSKSSLNMNSNQFNSMSELNDLNMSLATNMNNRNVGYNLPNNTTIKVDSSSTNSLLNIMSLKVAIEGKESTNSDFTKIERLVDFNWELTRNVNLIAVNNRKPLIAYVLNRMVRQNINNTQNNQMIRIMNYETRHRCLAKGVFHETIADLSFAINSISTNSLNIMKLAISDRAGNVYVYNLKEENGEIEAIQVLEIRNDGNKYELVRLSWCPYIPSEDDDTEVEGDPGLKLALSCDQRIELFAIDVLQELCKDSIVIEVSELKSNFIGYQIIENAHDLPITSLSISQEVTAICSSGLDDRVRFYKVSLNDKQNSSKMLKQWNLRNEYCYFEADDHISNFFFLDDFDFLMAQTDPSFWGNALIGTKKGHIFIVDLKDWRCRQSIRLLSEESSDLLKEGFAYKLDMSSHFLVSIRGSDAFLLHIRFPHDKEEPYDEFSLPVNNNYDNYDNSHPFISKVSRFQIYNFPLRSFFVKKSIDDNVLIFWINSQSLELCSVDLSLISIEEDTETFDMTLSNKLIETIGENTSMTANNEVVNASNIPINEIDLMNSTHINGFDGFDISMMIPNKTAINACSESQIMTPSIHTSDSVSSLNLAVIMPLPPPPTTFSQQKPFIQKLQRSESPASKEVQQILSPSLASKSLLSIGSKAQQLEETTFIKSNPENMSLDCLGLTSFPTKMPNILKDLVKEEHLLELKQEINKEIQDSENRIIQTIERLDHKMTARLNLNHDQLLNNSKVQTSKVETDIREMKKELKNACKIRNEEFNKIVEKLVNKVMHEMNSIVQKGFHELMANVDKEIKKMTISMDKSVIAMQNKLSQSIDNSNRLTTHFQPLNVPTNATPVTPATPLTPQQSQYFNITPRSPTFSNQRKTPQLVMNSTPSVSTTPLPFGTPRNAFQTPVSQIEVQTPQSYSQTEHLQQQKQQQLALQQQKHQQLQNMRNDVFKSVAKGEMEDAITKALNLRDPDLVVQICEIFQENPSKLVNAVKNDQLVLISLLQQIIFNVNPDESQDWKTGFIEQIMTNLDLENKFVIKILPGLAPKLVQMLNEIVKGGGTHAEKARLLAFTFKYLKV